jgi:tetratricopeptide (TPR) repeat protein
MTPTPESRSTARQPDLTALMARYLGRQSAAHAAGLAAVEPGAVEPYEAVPVQAVDPRQAWDEANAVLTHFGNAGKVGKAPADWPQLVAAQPSHTGLAFAAGNFPQMVRDLAPLYRAESLAELPAVDGPAVSGTAVDSWAEKAARADSFPQLRLALGALRLARQWDAAEALIQKHSGQVPAPWADAWKNETAAVLWHRGRKEEAARLWQALPESAPVLFNRGMAKLFLGRVADARAELQKAVERLPEASSWHHLGRLYLALAGG